MRTQLILGLSALLLLCAAAVNAQQTYDGRNGPHVFGSPGEQIYIRGQNEGTYQVPGVAGTFQNAPAQGQHVYTDEQGNSYVHQKKGAGRPGGHSISGPSLVAQRGQTTNPAQANSYRPRRCIAMGPNRRFFRIFNQNPYTQIQNASIDSNNLYNVNRRDFDFSYPDLDLDNGDYGPDGRPMSLSPNGGDPKRRSVFLRTLKIVD